MSTGEVGTYINNPVKSGVNIIWERKWCQQEKERVNTNQHTILNSYDNAQKLGKSNDDEIVLGAEIQSLWSFLIPTSLQVVMSDALYDVWWEPNNERTNHRHIISHYKLQPYLSTNMKHSTIISVLVVILATVSAFAFTRNSAFVRSSSAAFVSKKNMDEVTIKDIKQDVNKKMTDAKETASNKAGDTEETVSNKAGEVTKAVSGKADDAKEAASNKVDDMKESLGNMADEVSAKMKKWAIKFKASATF